MSLKVLSKGIFLTTFFLFAPAFGGNSSSSGLIGEAPSARIMRVTHQNAMKTMCIIHTQNIQIFEDNVLKTDVPKSLSDELVNLIDSQVKQDSLDFEKFCKEADLSDFIFVNGRKQIVGCQKKDQWLYLSVYRDLYTLILKTIENSCYRL